MRARYAIEVAAIRLQRTRTKAWLIVTIDADAGSVDQRRRQLARALEDSNETPRTASEPALNLAPKRNVETWIVCLNLEAVDEINDYRHDARVASQSIKQAARNVFAWTRPNCPIPSPCVPSLRDCLPEFDRLRD